MIRKALLVACMLVLPFQSGHGQCITPSTTSIVSIAQSIPCPTATLPQTFHMASLEQFRKHGVRYSPDTVERMRAATRSAPLRNPETALTT